MSKLVEKRVVVKNRAGLHLRPAQELCGRAMQYDSKITIHFRGKVFNAKSLLSVLSACVQQDDEIVLECSGSDETAAAEELTGFLVQ